MMKTLLLILGALALLALPALAGVVGKDGSKLPDTNSPPGQNAPRLPFDVDYSTAGAIDTPATLGGSADGWGTHFIASWTNNTGMDLKLMEFGWPCGGPGPVDWGVWITPSLPGAPGTWDYTGTFTPASSDPNTFPPPIYSYVDVSAADIIIADGVTFYWGYENPGIGGQVSYNGVETWAWYGGVWDPDPPYGRTAVLQFSANNASVGTEMTTFGQIKTLFR